MIEGTSTRCFLLPSTVPSQRKLIFNLFVNDAGYYFLALVVDREKKTTRYTLEQWQSVGYDRHSIYAHPKFADPETRDYRVKPDSPALKLGFQNFDMTSVGLLPEFPKELPERARQRPPPALEQ